MELDVLIVGAGFSGLYQLHRLRQDGYRVRIAEAGAGIGGVWHNNRYPGARVDSHVPNYEFSLEAVWRDWSWTERFPGRDELVAYFDHVADVLDLRPDIDLNTRVTAANYDETVHRWQVKTDGEHDYDCQVLVMATGFGSAPYVPAIAGLDEFAGICTHTARWPEALDLSGQRVGVIGTGASGVQVTQEAAAVASHLTVFQRTPVTAIPMQQRQLSVESQTAAKADYVEMFKRRNAPPSSFADLPRLNISALSVTDAERLDVFEAAWLKGGFQFWVGTYKDILIDETANRLAYDFWRAKVHDRVTDPDVAETLAPAEPLHPFGTKRPSLEQNYYLCFNEHHVDLVDVRANPIQRVTATGVQTSDGHHTDLDVLILATGFDANTGGLTVIDIRGRDNRSLAAAWADGVDTHMGMAIPGFPNLLMLYGPQSAASFCNGPVCAEIQGDWVAEFLNYLRRNQLTEFDSTMDEARAWTHRLAGIADSTLFGKADSWYMGANIPGKRRQLLNMPMSDGYLKRLEDCATNDYDGFVLTP